VRCAIAPHSTILVCVCLYVFVFDYHAHSFQNSMTGRTFAHQHRSYPTNSLLIPSVRQSIKTGLLILKRRTTRSNAGIPSSIPTHAPRRLPLPPAMRGSMDAVRAYSITLNGCSLLKSRVPRNIQGLHRKQLRRRTTFMMARNSFSGFILMRMRCVRGPMSFRELMCMFG
jgi:hypothetical protein